MVKIYDVVGFGALNWDDNREVYEVVLPGGETSGRVLQGTPGGSAANTICGLSRIGINTAFIGAVGNDMTGERLINDLQKENTEPMVLIKKGSSGNCIILVDDDGERSIYVFPEVNDTISVEDISQSMMEAVETAEYFYTATFACRDSYNSLETQLALAKKARRVCLSPGDLYTNQENKIRIEHDEIIDALLKETDVLFLNEKESSMLSGIREYKNASEMLGDNYDIGIIAVTRGEKGCYIGTRDKEMDVPAYRPERIKDTTGAGDAFAAGFLWSLLKMNKIEYCGKMGNYVASKCIEETGARDGLPYIGYGQD